MGAVQAPMVTSWSVINGSYTSLWGTVGYDVTSIPFVSRLVIAEISALSWHPTGPGPGSRTHAWNVSRSVNRAFGTRDVHKVECSECGMFGIVIDRKMKRRLSPPSMRNRSNALIAQATVCLEGVSDCQTAKVMSVLDS